MVGGTVPRNWVTREPLEKKLYTLYMRNEHMSETTQEGEILVCDFFLEFSAPS